MVSSRRPGALSRRQGWRPGSLERSSRNRISNSCACHIRQSWNLGPLRPAPAQADKLAVRPVGGRAEGDLSQRDQGRGRLGSSFPCGAGIQRGHQSALREFGKTPQTAGKPRARGTDVRLLYSNQGSARRKDAQARNVAEIAKLLGPILGTERNHVAGYGEIDFACPGVVRPSDTVLPLESPGRGRAGWSRLKGTELPALTTPRCLSAKRVSDSQRIPKVSSPDRCPS